MFEVKIKKSDIVVPLLDGVVWWSSIGQNKSWKLTGVILFLFIIIFPSVYTVQLGQIEFDFAQFGQKLGIVASMF